MKILFTLGSAPVTLYGAMTAASLLLFWIISMLYFRKETNACKAAPCWMLCTALCGWLVARVVFVAADFGYYFDELDGYWTPALYFWDGGYSMIGMILGVLLGAVLCSRLTGVKRSALLNGAGLGLMGGITLMRLGEFLCDTETSGDIGEGKYLEGGWVDDLLGRLGLLMEADGDKVYPACLAEFAVVFIIFVALLIWIHRAKQITGADVLTVSLLLYGTAQLVLEQIRDDGHLVFHFVHIQQVLALGLVLAALIVWTVRAAKSGMKKGLLIAFWTACVVCFGLAILACFGVDRWENKLAAWSLLIIPTVVVACGGLWLRSRAEVK